MGVPPSTASRCKTSAHRCPPRAAAGADRAFTLTEVMVVLLMLGLLSALAMPYMGRDHRSRDGREFAQTLARDFQRARMEAISERLALHLFVFQDRVEMRSAVPGLRPGESPRAPTLSDPVLRVLLAEEGILVMDVLPAASSPSLPALSTTTHRTIEVNSRGQAQLLGHPALTPAFVYVRNTRLPSSHPDRELRVDIVPLTASVAVRDKWQ
jgi:prepilin-type N-terminal cleavage/methylation domain-containing protein